MPDIDIDYATGIPFWVTILDFIESVSNTSSRVTTTWRSCWLCFWPQRHFLSLVKIVTFFTIAHSVTLVLATLDGSSCPLV